jgi:hypothetical protein
MNRKLLVTGFTFSLAISMAGAADTARSRATLSAAEIVSKNVAARGGLEAWRGVQTISFTGKLGAGGNQRATIALPLPGKSVNHLPVPPRPKEEVQLPFVMDMQRPGKERFEIQFKGQTAVQVFDGANGWKLRPYLNRLEVEPFSADELKVASMQAELDGPLVDYAAKGTKVEFEGMEKVEDRDTYKLKLTLKNGNAIHVWIDAQTFLEAKIEGQPRRLDGKDHPVEVYYRDYRPVGGLQVPFVLETKVLPLAGPSQRVKEIPVPVERISVEKVVLNAKLDASLFSKPQVNTAPGRH